MLRKLALPAAIVIAGLLIIVLLVAAKPEPEPGPVPDDPAHVTVSVMPAQQESLRLPVRTQGTVRPRREIDLVAQVSGRVMSVEPAFVSGGFFEASQVLIRIDDREYRAALLDARSRVADAEQRLAEEQGRSLQARREWRDLGDQTANDLFLRKPQLAAAQANLEAARGALAVAELNLERTRINVPFKGRVRETRANLGQYVSAGTSLATVYDSTIVEVRLPLTESQAALIDLPLTPGVHEPIQATIIGSVAGEQHQWKGQLTRTDAFVDTDSRMYYAIVEVADPFAIDGSARVPLLPGLFVTAEIRGKRLDGVMKLPRAALFERDKLLTLDSENAIAIQQVQVLRRTETEAWIRAAITENTLITLDKQSLTPVGTVVNPILPDGTTPKAEPQALAAAPSGGTASPDEPKE